MSNDIVSQIWKVLRSTGTDGFAGMVGALLGSLTQKRFRLARSGGQGGRDLTTDALETTVIAVECKRYGHKREFDQAELLGKLNEAVLDLPELDLWVLVASRAVPTQLQQLLVRAGRKDAVEVRFIEAGGGPPPSMFVLLAHAPDIVLRYVEGKVHGREKWIRSDLQAVALSPAFPAALQRLRDGFSDAALGYDHWRSSQNQALIGVFQNAATSRARLRQVVRVSTIDPSLVERATCLRALDDWYSEWPQAHRPVVVLGEEGDGKTWAVADWVARRQTKGSFPSAVLVNAQLLESTRPSDLLAQAVSSELGGAPEFWTRRLGRWCSLQGREFPSIVLVLDGLDERPNFGWRALLEGLGAEPWRQTVAVALTCRTAFWQRHFEALRYLDVGQQVVAPFSDSELELALERRGVCPSDLSDDLLPLLRRPRYLDLALRLRERLAGSGDVTRQRLLYEDWKDRHERKATALHGRSFQDVLMNLARLARKGEKRHSADIVESALPSGTQRDAALVELSTGGILVESQGRFVIEEERLVQGMGLLLAEEVPEVAGAGESVVDHIEQWLEPDRVWISKGECWKQP